MKNHMVRENPRWVKMINEILNKNRPKDKNRRMDENYLKDWKNPKIELAEWQKLLLETIKKTRKEKRRMKNTQK